MAPRDHDHNVRPPLLPLPYLPAAHLPPQTKQADADGMIPVSSEYSSLPEVVVAAPAPANHHRPTYPPQASQQPPAFHHPAALPPPPLAYEFTPVISPLTPHAPGATPFLRQPSPFAPPPPPPPPPSGFGYEGPLPGGAGPGYGPPVTVGGLGPLAAARRRRRRRMWLVVAAAVVVVLVGAFVAVAFALGWIRPKSRGNDGRVTTRRWDGGGAVVVAAARYGVRWAGRSVR